MFTQNLVQPFFFHAALQLQIEAKDLLARYPTERTRGKRPLFKSFSYRSRLTATDSSGASIRGKLGAGFRRVSGSERGKTGASERGTAQP